MERHARRHGGGAAGADLALPRADRLGPRRLVRLRLGRQRRTAEHLGGPPRAPVARDRQGLPHESPETRHVLHRTSMEAALDAVARAHETRAGTWLWYLDPIDETHTRLITRMRDKYRWTRPAVCRSRSLVELATCRSCASACWASRRAPSAWRGRGGRRRYRGDARPLKGDGPRRLLVSRRDPCGASGSRAQEVNRPGKWDLTRWGRTVHQPGPDGRGGSRLCRRMARAHSAQ